ncbi:MAG: substrate-binding domain-containing protein [Akkermansiaceae bacterium]|nr:substrate-binding domain-containing protein [Akkermansiaceae bacterium]
MKLLSHAEQVAEYLRSELLHGRWIGSMPGALALKAELGVGHNTIDLALRQLEAEGILVHQGTGKCRRIILPERHVSPRMRIAILLYEPDNSKVGYHLELLQQLRERGHTAFFTTKSLTTLGMDVKRVAQFVKQTEADAWVVVAGSRAVLGWFAEQPFPVFGFFGRTMNLPIASTSPKKIPALVSVVRRLVSLDHRRIVLIAREERRKPVPGFIEQAFLNELDAHGIPTGSYNLPDWEETREGLHRMLDTLFLHTPPTALLIQGTPFTVAALQYFASRGLEAPQDISLVAMDPDPAFAWCDPPISHISYDSRPWLRRIIRWAENVANGKDDLRKSSSPAKFVEGGTIGPVKK